MKKRLMYMTIGLALGAVLTTGTAVIAQQAPPAAPTPDPDPDPDPGPATDAFEVPLPEWGETKIREWKEADSGSFADAVQSANLPDVTFVAFAKLDGSAPCSDTENCKGWFGSLSEASRKTALTRLAAALANSLASLGFDRDEVKELGFTGLIGKIEENRALLSVARLQRDVQLHDGTLYGIAGVQDGGKAIRRKQHLERKVDRQAEEVEKLDEVHSDLLSAAEKIHATIAEADGEAIRKVREKRHAAAVAKAEAAATKLAAARKRLGELETELAGGPQADPNAPAHGGGAAGSGSGTVN